MTNLFLRQSGGSWSATRYFFSLSREKGSCELWSRSKRFSFSKTCCMFSYILSCFSVYNSSKGTCFYFPFSSSGFLNLGRFQASANPTTVRWVNSNSMYSRKSSMRFGTGTCLFSAKKRNSSDSKCSSKSAFVRRPMNLVQACVSNSVIFHITTDLCALRGASGLALTARRSREARVFFSCSVVTCLFPCTNYIMRSPWCFNISTSSRNSVTTVSINFCESPMLASFSIAWYLEMFWWPILDATIYSSNFSITKMSYKKFRRFSSSEWNLVCRRLPFTECSIVKRLYSWL